MYKIGEFSKIVDIPVRTLRYYAEYGVLILMKLILLLDINIMMMKIY